MSAAVDDSDTKMERSGYALLACGWALFVAYGSLVPFDFRYLPLGVALDTISQGVHGPLTIASRTDFATNVLLAVPLSYAALAALRTDRQGLIGDRLAAVVAVLLCACFSGGVELTPVFFPNRTSSLSDVIAQSVGAIGGVSVWLAVGRRVTEWLRASLRERRRPALVQRLLLAYCVVFVITQLLPLDLTLGLGDLARKYRAGRILLKPFSYPYDSTIEMAWGYVGGGLLYAPLGAAAFGGVTAGRRHLTWVAGALGMCAVGLIECAQVFVISRVADVTDVLIGSTGVAAGVVAAKYLSEDEQLEPPRVRAWPTRSMIAIPGVVVWTLALMSYHWNPFDFSLDPEQVTRGAHRLLSVPFRSYYATTYARALSELLGKWSLAFPLGVFLRLAVPVRRRSAESSVLTLVAAITGFVILLGIECGQVFLPSHAADITDPIIGAASVLTAMWLTSRVAAASAAGPRGRQPGGARPTD